MSQLRYTPPVHPSPACLCVCQDADDVVIERRGRRGEGGLGGPAGFASSLLKCEVPKELQCSGVEFEKMATLTCLRHTDCAALLPLTVAAWPLFIKLVAVIGHARTQSEVPLDHLNSFNMSYRPSVQLSTKASSTHSSWALTVENALE